MTREEFINWFQGFTLLTPNDIYDLGQLYDEVTKPQWISVEDELPMEYEPVLAAFGSHYARVCFYCGGKWYLDAGVVSDEVFGVSHWIQIPAPPKRRKEARMRTIKFRGRRCDDGEWVFGIPIRYIRNNRSDRWTMHDGRGKEYDIHENTIGQFTGLYDKNDEEIYEGDVVKFVNPKYGDELLRIGYEDSHIGAFCLCEAGEEDTSRFVAIFGRFDYEPFYCKVIGNIHDNPDLMKGGDE